MDKNVLILMVPILINKDVFEPSYNDLKFTVWNCNYICINLILKYCIVNLCLYKDIICLLFPVLKN